MTNVHMDDDLSVASGNPLSNHQKKFENKLTKAKKIIKKIKII